MGGTSVCSARHHCWCRYRLTAAHFIDALGTMKGQIEGAVSSSDASTEKLKSLGIHVFDLNEVDSLGIYVDGADEINGHMPNDQRRRRGADP